MVPDIIILKMVLSRCGAQHTTDFIQMFNQETIKNIKSVDISLVVGRRIQLAKKGKDFKACCPFHDEKTPSFTVNIVKGYWKCFGGCGGGDVINFVELYDRVDFITAVKRIAEENNIQIDYDDHFDHEAYKSEKDERSRCHVFLNEVASIYQKELKNNKAAYDYLINRGWKAETIIKHRLGFAPDAWDTIKKWALSRQQYDLGVKTGVITETLDNKNRDTFRNRIMFPIMDPKGNVISFSGRSIDDSQPKYLNTTNTLLYTKDQVLYGLNWFDRNVNEAFLVEGYADVIACMQQGLYAAASCGALLSKNQCQQMKKYAKNWILALDNDGNKDGVEKKKKTLAKEKNIRNTFASIDTMLENGIIPKVLTLPDGGPKDLDEFFKQQDLVTIN